MLGEMREDDGWLVTTNKPDLRVLYKHQKGMTCSSPATHVLGNDRISFLQCFSSCCMGPGSAIYSIRIEAVLEAPFEHVLALAAEYDLTTMWNPVMRETVVLHASLPWLTWFYGALWTPVVVIDVAVKAEGFDLGEVDAHCHALTYHLPNLCSCASLPVVQPAFPMIGQPACVVCGLCNFLSICAPGGQEPGGGHGEHGRAGGEAVWAAAT